MDQKTIEFIVLFGSILALLLILVFYTASKRSRSGTDMPAADSPTPGATRAATWEPGPPPGSAPGGYPGGTVHDRSGPEKEKDDSLGKAGALEKTSYVWSTGEEKYAGKASGESGGGGGGLKRGRFGSASTKKDKEEKVLDTDIETIYRFHYSKRLRICPFCGSENDVSNPVCECCKESLR